MEEPEVDEEHQEAVVVAEEVVQEASKEAKQL